VTASDQLQLLDYIQMHILTVVSERSTTWVGSGRVGSGHRSNFGPGYNWAPVKKSQTLDIDCVQH